MGPVKNLVTPLLHVFFVKVLVSVPNYSRKLSGEMGTVMNLANPVLHVFCKYASFGS